MDTVQDLSFQYFKTVVYIKIYKNKICLNRKFLLDSLGWQNPTVVHFTTPTAILMVKCMDKCTSIIPSSSSDTSKIGWNESGFCLVF